MSQVQIPLKEAYRVAEFFIEWLKVLLEQSYLCVVECLTETLKISGLLTSKLLLNYGFENVKKKNK